MALTSTALLRMLRECKTLQCLLQVHGKLTVSGLKPHNQLINAYSLFQRPNLSRIIFDSVQDPGVVLCNSMIRGYTRAGLHREALELFRYMSEEKGIVPDKYSLAFALKACTGASDLERGLGIHELVSEMGFESDVYIGTALVEMYCKGGDLVSAREVFDEMPERDTISWNIMVSGGLIDMYCKCADLDAAECVFEDVWSKDDSSWGTMMAAYAHNGCFTRVLEFFDVMRSYDVRKSTVSWNIMMNGYLINGQAEEAIAAFRQMKNGNFQPNIVTYVNILHAAAQLAALRVGMCVHARLIRLGYSSHTAVGNSLLDMYAKCGMIESSERCFVEIRNKDMASWNTMLYAYAVNGLASSAVSLFLLMQENELRLDSVPFLSVLSACRHAGLVEEGKRVFKDMEERHEIEAEIEHHACMVDLLGKAGLFGEAVEMVRRMRMKASVGVWGALLSCSRMHCNLWLSNAALCQLVKLEPLFFFFFFLIKKLPACSWIQV
ncbi:BnaA03g18650D [Brassica napus]|uniref:BnaA03g18650D protein n=1 Tax=Brassica napus TaxID=3708 RepID=A0A078F2P8_BRANA|nr:BnaA03g18650D [Brassica napus]